MFSVETFTDRRRRFTTEMRPSGDAIWEEQSVNGPSRGRVLSQAVRTDTGLRLGDLQSQSHGCQYALADFRRAAAPETFPAPTHHPWREPLDLAPGQRTPRSAAETLLNGCVYIPNVLDGEECAVWRQALERDLEPDRPGFADYQLRSRCAFNDQSLAEELPQGGFLAKHCDAMYEKSDDERSFFTPLLYLNGNLDGDSTRFLKTGHDAAIDGSGPCEATREDEVVCTVNPEMVA